MKTTIYIIIVFAFCLSCQRKKAIDVEPQANFPLIDIKAFGDSSFFVGSFMGRQVRITNLNNAYGKGDCPLKNSSKIWFTNLNHSKPPIIGINISAQYGEKTIDEGILNHIFSLGEKPLTKISSEATLEKEGFLIQIFEGNNQRESKLYSSALGKQEADSFLRIISHTRTNEGKGVAKPVIEFKTKLYDSSGRYVGTVVGIAQLGFDIFL